LQFKETIVIIYKFINRNKVLLNLRNMQNVLDFEGI
jgi:FtsZ-interacting cell division protein YlmF